MAEHNETGQKGEELAAAYLKDKGYEILEMNWRFLHLEADIIATIRDVLVVAEVKTRKSNHYGEPETFVTRQKQQNLIRTAHEYIQRKGLDLEVRFDIVSVISGKEKAMISHIEGAFYPLLGKASKR